MDWYLIKELLLPFAFGLGLFSALLLAIGTGFDLIRQVAESGLLLYLALQILLLRLPSFLVYAFPAALLLATLLGYGRLNSDSELVALRGAGVSVYRLMLPGLLLSLVITGVTFYVNDQIAPAALFRASNLAETAFDRAAPSLREENILYPEYKKFQDEDGRQRTVLARLFYAEEYDGERLYNLTVIDRAETGLSQVIVAKSAAWNIAKNTWDMFEGTIYLVGEDGTYRNVVQFEQQQLALPRKPKDLANRRRDYGEMSIAQAQAYLAASDGNERRERKLRVRIQEKMAFPFICIVFALVGGSLGLRAQTSSRGTSFGICVGLIFGYYLLSFLTSALGVWGAIPPLVSAWLPNILGLSCGLGLLWQSAR
ncbi:MAG: LptF/LptG family permease [Cyanobacteria bacterium P01_H01_bin.15]